MNNKTPISPSSSIIELKKRYSDLYEISHYIPVRLSVRIFDFIVGSVLFVLSIPLWVAIFIIFVVESLLDKTSRGLLFVSYESCSQGRNFSKLKFRICKMDHIDMDLLRQHNYKALPDEDFLDPKDFTFLGGLLKQTFLDELPQIINILRGDISIVGPRAIPVEVDERLRKEGFLYHLLKSGLISDKHARKGSDAYNDTYLFYDYVRIYLHSPWYSLMWRNIMIIKRGITISLQRKGRYTRTGE